MSAEQGGHAVNTQHVEGWLSCVLVFPALGMWLARAPAQPGWRECFMLVAQATQVGTWSEDDEEGPTGGGKWTPEAAREAQGSSGSPRAGPGRCPLVGSGGNVGLGHVAWLGPCTSHHGLCLSVVRQGHGLRGQML